MSQMSRKATSVSRRNVQTRTGQGLKRCFSKSLHQKRSIARRGHLKRENGAPGRSSKVDPAAPYDPLVFWWRSIREYLDALMHAYQSFVLGLVFGVAGAAGLFLSDQSGVRIAALIGVALGFVVAPYQAFQRMRRERDAARSDTRIRTPDSTALRAPTLGWPARWEGAGRLCGKLRCLHVAAGSG
jgi:hypothetical protein